MSQDKKAESITKGARFHESLASNWSIAYESGGFKRRIIFFEYLLTKIVLPDSLWLDAGCGSGRLSRVIKLLGGQVVAVDGSPKMIEYAQKESMDFGDSINYKLVNTIEVMDFQPNSFDNVLCSSVIEYIDQPEKALCEFFRIIRSDGLLLVSVPNRFSLIRLTQKGVRILFKLFGKDIYQYLLFSKNDYSLAEIRSLLNQTGFVIERVELFDPILPACFSRFFVGSLFVITARKPHWD